MQSSGRHREEAAWRAFEDALRARHDARRPLGRYRVVDNAPWSATGASFVWLRVNGARRLAIYRDGPQPPVDTYLQAVETSGDPTAPLLALPLPPPATGCGMVYVSGYSLATGAWRIFRCDTAVGNAWQDRSAHPLGGATYARRPLQRLVPGGYFVPGSYNSFARASRLYTWGSDLAYGTPGALHGSDDNGATWADQGIAIVNLTRWPSNEGYLYAVSATDLYYTADGGDTWGLVSGGGPGGTLVAVDVADAAGDFAIRVMTTAGVYSATVFHDTLASAWTGPESPVPGTSAAVRAGESFDGGDIYTSGVVSDTLAGTLTPGAGEAFEQFRGAGADVYHVATDHPGGLAGILAADFAQIRDPGTLATCRVVGLHDATVGAGHTRYVLYSSPGPWVVLDARQVSDLGAAYVPSADGLSQ